MATRAQVDPVYRLLLGEQVQPTTRKASSEDSTLILVGALGLALLLLSRKRRR